MDPRGSALQSCGCHSARYTGGLVFARVAPPVVASDRMAGTAPELGRIASPNVKLEVILPPPRVTH